MRRAVALLRTGLAVSLFAACGIAASADVPTPDEEAINALKAVYTRAVQPGDQAQMYERLIATVLQRIKRSHVQTIDLPSLAAIARREIEGLPPYEGDPATVFKKGIQEALKTIDSYTRYLDLRAQSNDRDSGSGFSGLGIEVEAGVKAGTVRVVSPMPGGPAARAGVEAGDVIVRIDDQPLDGLPLADAITRMRGEAGTQVSISYVRGTSTVLTTVSLTRETIKRQVLRSSMEGDVLVLRLSGFTDTAASSIEQAIAQATADGKQPHALVLDMRGNPGGLLREAVKIDDMFLTRGDIVSLRGNAQSRGRTWQADPAELLPGVPMVVLVDQRSASASELVADALQFNGRATVMGQRSYGKGSVQTTYSLGDNRGALKMTTALYHGPSGATLHHIGVIPDVEIIMPRKEDPTLDPAPTTPKASVDPARCTAVRDRDPALACAVSFLHTQGIEAFVTSLTAASP